MANRRYYWLKLQETFFTDKKIKRLRKLAGGDTYTIIYLKLLLLSLKDEGKLYFDNVENSFCEELALEIDEEEDDVQVTVNFLISKGLIEIIRDDEYKLTEIPDMIGSETASTRRSRKSREEKEVKKKLENKDKALQCNTNATDGNKMQQNCNGELELELEKELDIDIELELKLEKELNKELYRELELEEPPPTKNSNLSTNLSTELYTSEKMTRKEIEKILKPYNLTLNDIHVVSVKLEERQNKGLKADKEYLQEKIDFMKFNGKEIREHFGYFVKAVKEDWDRSKRPFKKTNDTNFKKTGFHNFDGHSSQSGKYSDEYLNSLMKNRNKGDKC